MDESSHVNHVGVAVLVFLLGGIVGYYVGSAYEADNQGQVQYDQSVFYGLHKKAVKTATPAVSPTTVKPATTSTTVTPAVSSSTTSAASTSTSGY